MRCCQTSATGYSTLEIAVFFCEKLMHEFGMKGIGRVRIIT